MNIRAFLALPLKRRAVRRLADHADTLCHLDLDGEVQWVDSDNYHLTLCFLGNVSLKRIAELERQAFERLQDVSSFQLTLDAAQYYRVNDQLALLAALARQEKSLMALRERMVEIITDVGVTTRQQDFIPHVTLGRMDGQNRFIEPDHWPPFNLLSLVDSVVLYQSKAGSNGSIYTPLFSVPLGAQADSR